MNPDKNLLTKEVRSTDLPAATLFKSSDASVPLKSTDNQVQGSPITLGHSVIDVEKTKLNGSSLNKVKKRQLKSNVGAAWGKLISQCSQNPHFVMHCPTYSVGQGRQCDLWIGDPSVSKSLCNLKHIEQEKGGFITLLEITGKKGDVQVNGKVYPKILLCLSMMVMRWFLAHLVNMLIYSRKSPMTIHLVCHVQLAYLKLIVDQSRDYMLRQGQGTLPQ